MAGKAGPLYLSEAEYEAMTELELVEHLSPRPGERVKEVLRNVFGLDSVVYFMSKVECMAYIRERDRRPELLAAGKAKQAEHRERGKENRARPGSAQDRLDAETKGRLYRQVAMLRKTPETDVFTGRKISTPHIIEDVVDGTRFAVSRMTAKWLADHGRLEGFAVGRHSVAHAAGKKTAADVLSGKTEAEAEPVNGGDAGVGKALSADELDELLNSLPS